jgi:hypothetical protein
VAEQEGGKGCVGLGVEDMTVLDVVDSAAFHVIVMLDQIREVRYGPQARPAVDELPQALATSNNWISIIYIRWPSSWKTLNVVARSDDIFKLWVDTIASLLGSIKSISHEKGCIGILGALETIPFTRPAAWSLDSAIDEKSTVSLSDISKMCAKIGLPSAPGSLVVESFRVSLPRNVWHPRRRLVKVCISSTGPRHRQEGSPHL